MEISFWFDYACPYCYVTDPTLLHAVESTPELKGSVIRTHAYQIAPDAPAIAPLTNEQIMIENGDSQEHIQERLEGFDQLAASRGLKIDFGGMYPANTMDAHRLTMFVAEQGDEDLNNRWRARLFKANFVDNVELGDRKVLESLAQEFNLDAAAVSELLDSDKYVKEVHEDEKAAVDLGAQGVPFIVANGMALNSAASEDEIREFLLKAQAAQ